MPSFDSLTNDLRLFLGAKEAVSKIDKCISNDQKEDVFCEEVKTIQKDAYRSGVMSGIIYGTFICLCILLVVTKGVLNA